VTFRRDCTGQLRSPGETIAYAGTLGAFSGGSRLGARLRTSQGGQDTTPFMLAVQDVLDGCAAPEPATVRSRLLPVPAATDVQVRIRSLAEQLVCEANAVLRETGDVITLDDECGPGALSFTLGYRGRSARVRTAVSGQYAQARLFVAGEPRHGPRCLAGEGELRALLLTLIHLGTSGADPAIRVALSGHRAETSHLSEPHRPVR
jgi:hypothetical protein